MISYIRGELAAISEDKVVVDVNGVGYGIFMSGKSIGSLPQIGREVKIHTYMNVKEDAMQLFGFISADDLRVFKLVIAVSGIGPKGGLNILSQLTADELRFAVAANDIKAISAAPGIGKKTAEKLILELRDKLNLEEALDHIGQAPNAGASSAGGDQADAVEALVALGYGSTEAMKAVRRVQATADMGSDAILKQALKYIGI
ncbi:MAG: Holliday junction branch migration protein RuvA [Lachnospiraceae bacterium]